jgi:cell division protease FtsH
MSEKKPDSPRRRSSRREPPGGPGARLSRGLFGWIVLIAMAVVLYLLINKQNSRPKDIDLAEFNAALYAGGVETLIIEGNTVRGKWRTGYIKADDEAAKRQQENGFQLRLHPNYINDTVLNTWAWHVRGPAGAEGAAGRRGKIIYEDSNNLVLQIFVGLLPWVLILAFIWFFLFRQLRASAGTGGMLNFGKTRARFMTKEHVNITFDDVAGIEEAKEEVQEIIEFLKNPKRFQRLGGRIPRGVLLTGEPGCGKTLLAKAIAGEADVPFLSICGSDFVEMFVGVGASRVRDLFKQAKENSPCIIFLDEIDAVGRRRGSGFQSGGHDEREQTLNAILVEMDGFDTNDQVIVIAATNRPDVLDPALRRPGRFDRHIHIPLPDIRGRLEILKVHARNVKMGGDAELERIARGTPGFSGADLAAVINEAALAATMANQETIRHGDLEEARDKLLLGRARKSLVMDEKTKRETAYHEAGHAVLMYFLPDGDPLHKVTIIPRGRALGISSALPETDRFNAGRKYILAKLKSLFGGRIAEEMFLADIDAGAAMDIRQATELARKMVCEWGMSDKLGFVNYTHEESASELIVGKPYSEQTAQEIDAEVKRIIDTAYGEANSVLEAHRGDVERLADALLKYETLDRAEVEKVLKGEPLDSRVIVRRDDKKPEPRPTGSPAGAEPAGGIGGVPLPQPGA